jgi:hypothetical protein
VSPASAVWLLVFTQLCPGLQLDEDMQASWHLPMSHTRNLSQSLLSTHEPPTATPASFDESLLFDELSQPTASHENATTKPRMRDADISNLQFATP